MLCSVPLSDVKAKSPRWRFNISLLSNQTFITSLKEYIKDFLELNNLIEIVSVCVRERERERCRAG